MEKKRILVVDDEQDLCEILHFNLTASGYDVDVCHSAEEALKKELHNYDLLLLDVMMPGMSGFELAKQVKTSNNTTSLPIIFLTAKDAEDDTLLGFNIGADDYITKPFSVREVVARVKAVLNRTKRVQNKEILIYDGLKLDLLHKTVVIDGKKITLTKTEFELLCMLFKHNGEVFSRPQLLKLVWPQDVIVTERTIDVNIARLRKKLGRYAQCLVSRQGFGYCFEKQEL